MSDRRQALERLLGVGLAGAAWSAQAQAPQTMRTKPTPPGRATRRMALVLGGG